MSVLVVVLQYLFHRPLQLELLNQFSRTHRETRKQYIVRLRRAAMRMPESFLAPLVRSMKRRCAALRAVDGNDFEE